MYPGVVKTQICFFKTHICFFKTHISFYTPRGCLTKVQMATENACDAWLCRTCGMTFSNKYEFGPHIRNCGYCGSDSNSDSSSTTTSSVESAEMSEDANEEVEENTEDANEETTAGIWDLARRAEGRSEWGVSTIINTAYPNLEVQNDFVADFCEMQNTYKRYVHAVYNLCDPSFWKIFATLHNVNSKTVENVLGETRKVLKAHTTGVQVGHRFPASRRTLNRRIDNKAGMFWDNVTETHVIDLRQYNLPKVGKVEFTFISPIWVWIRRCQMLHNAGCELFFQPQVLRHPTSGLRSYGGGVQKQICFIKDIFAFCKHIFAFRKRHICILENIFAFSKHTFHFLYNTHFIDQNTHFILSKHTLCKTHI